MPKNTLTMSFAEGAAPAVDAALAALEQVPGVGMAVGILKARDDYLSRMLRAKLKSFLDGLGRQSHADIEAMTERFSDPKQCQQMGETLLLTLDSYTALDKCELLGRLFLGYLQGHLSNIELRRLALAINGAFSDDLQAFIDEDFMAERVLGQQYGVGLERVGLIRAKPGALIYSGIAPDPVYETTDLGLRMKYALHQVASTTE